jgi:hypothetical protein
MLCKIAGIQTASGVGRGGIHAEENAGAPQPVERTKVEGISAQKTAAKRFPEGRILR